MRILICDDEGIVQQAIRFMIQKSFGDEFEIESAKNGRMAIELAESFRPDIILMDIRMPVMSGLEAARQIRAMSRTDAQTVPIIAMTANAYEEDVSQSLAAGMNAHLAKPIEPQVILDTLAGYIGSKN